MSARTAVGSLSAIVASFRSAASVRFFVLRAPVCTGRRRLPTTTSSP